MTSYMLVGLYVVALLLLPAQVVTAQENGDEQGTVFEITSLRIEPPEASAGQEGIITAEVTNTGDAEGTYAVSLEINSEVEISQDVTLAAGETKSVEFGYTPLAEGDYTIVIGDQTASLKVPPAPEAILTAATT